MSLSIARRMQAAAEMIPAATLSPSLPVLLGAARDAGIPLAGVWHADRIRSRYLAIEADRLLGRRA